MIDKLTLATNTIDFKNLESCFNGSYSVQFTNNQYQRCFRYISHDTGQHLFSIYTKPYLPINEVRIELNPTRLAIKYSELMTSLEKCICIDSTQIQRIDHASDNHIDIENAFNTVRFKFKRKMMVYSDYYRGNLTGFYIGSKHEQILIYDKRFQLKGREFRPNTENSSLPNLTRFELRQKFQALTIRNLRDLPKLTNYDPFKMIETYQIEPLREGIINNSWRGLHSTFQKLNAQNNAKRNYKKYLIQSDLKDNVTNNYWYNLGQFFMETENENA